MNGLIWAGLMAGLIFGSGLSMAYAEEADPCPSIINDDDITESSYRIITVYDSNDNLILNITDTVSNNASDAYSYAVNRIDKCVPDTLGYEEQVEIKVEYGEMLERSFTYIAIKEPNPISNPESVYTYIYDSDGFFVDDFASIPNSPNDIEKLKDDAYKQAREDINTSYVPDPIGYGETVQIVVNYKTINYSTPYQVPDDPDADPPNVVNPNVDTSNVDDPPEIINAPESFSIDIENRYYLYEVHSDNYTIDNGDPVSYHCHVNDDTDVQLATSKQAKANLTGWNTTSGFIAKEKIDNWNNLSSEILDTSWILEAGVHAFSCRITDENDNEIIHKHTITITSDRVAPKWFKTYIATLYTLDIIDTDLYLKIIKYLQRSGEVDFDIESNGLGTGTLDGLKAETENWISGESSNSDYKTFLGHLADSGHFENIVI